MAMIRTCAGDPSAWLIQYQAHRPLFACILSFTETGTIQHISAAGTTPDARRYTALADGELLSVGRSYHRLPPLKAGVSPAIISRAVLSRQNIPVHLLSTGLPDALKAPHIALPKVIAQSVKTGQAMTYDQVKALFESGLYWGHRLAQQCLDSYLILSECVVGGTTTAQAVLTALGYNVADRMSSSRHTSNHQQKRSLVEQGLRCWRSRHSFSSDFSPLAAIAAVGDPMQAVAAGVVLSASKHVGILLAGGSQMLAVYAIAQALSGEGHIQNRQLQSRWFQNRWFQNRWLQNKQRVVVGTTRWVVEDTSADTVAIARAIGAPYLASEINFSRSPYFQLRAYERGFVKEGVGAGGCAIASHLYKKWTNAQLRHAVESELRKSS